MVQWDFVCVCSCVLETAVLQKRVAVQPPVPLPASEATRYCRTGQVWVCQDGGDWWASTVWKIFTFYRAALITFTPWMCRSREINLGVFLCRCRRPSYVTWAEASCARQTSTLPNANTVRKHSCNSSVSDSISAQLFGLPCGFPAYHRSWADVLFAISVWQYTDSWSDYHGCFVCKDHCNVFRTCRINVNGIFYSVSKSTNHEKVNRKTGQTG